MAALFTSTSSRPKTFTVSATAAFTAPASPLSAWMAKALPPFASISATTSAARAPVAE